MTDSQAKFERIRAALEAADRALAEALDRRVDAVLELAALRAAEPEGYFTPPRDADAVARVAEQVHSFPVDGIRPVMAEVLSVCQQLVSPAEVAYAGQLGGFAHLAARKHFGAAASLHTLPTGEAVLSKVERGHCAYGVLPFETSYDGAVTLTLNLLARSEVKICAEVPVRRTFHLVGQGRTEDLKRIYASSSAVTACAAYLAEHFAHVEVLDARNGVAAAEKASSDGEAAALTTAVVAELVNLPFMERNIEDTSDLHTRYVIVGNDYPARTGADRTAIALALHDAPGVLINCLRPFAERKINLYRLETRPARGWEFRYLVLFELDGHITDRPLLAAIEELRAASHYVKVLGSYPRAADV